MSFMFHTVMPMPSNSSCVLPVRLAMISLLSLWSLCRAKQVLSCPPMISGRVCVRFAMNMKYYSSLTRCKRVWAAPASYGVLSIGMLSLYHYLGQSIGWRGNAHRCLHVNSEDLERDEQQSVHSYVNNGRESPGLCCCHRRYQCDARRTRA